MKTNIHHFSPKILIIEDHDELRNALSSFLYTKGYEIFAAHHGLDALNILKQNSIHILITDYNMPFVSGIELIEEIKKNEWSIKLIILMSEGHESQREQEIQHIRSTLNHVVPVYFMQKPLKGIHIIQLIEQLNLFYKSLDKD